MPVSELGTESSAINFPGYVGHTEIQRFFLGHRQRIPSDINKPLLHLVWLRISYHVATVMPSLTYYCKAIVISWLKYYTRLDFITKKL